MKFNWGTGIALVLFLFVAVMGSLVYYLYQNSINLVHEDYYPRELAHQSMIEKRNNAYELKERLTIKNENGWIEVKFPDVFNYDSLSGEIQLFRPSSGVKDVFILVRPDKEGFQRIPDGALDQGKYIVKVDWAHKGSFYYTEQEIYIKK
jgi:hypothetical protein